MHKPDEIHAAKAKILWVFSPCMGLVKKETHTHFPRCISTVSFIRLYCLWRTPTSSKLHISICYSWDNHDDITMTSSESQKTLHGCFFNTWTRPTINHLTFICKIRWSAPLSELSHGYGILLPPCVQGCCKQEEITQSVDLFLALCINVKDEKSVLMHIFHTPCINTYK